MNGLPDAVVRKRAPSRADATGTLRCSVVTGGSLCDVMRNDLRCGYMPQND
ncbi:hypothetical protein Save01_08307 [Streptomyces avermitilis]